MGVDYSRFRLKPDVDRAVLEPLIERQSLAFQSMWGWNSHACSDVNDVPRALSEALHLETYLAASNRLRTHIELPDWDDERGCSTDRPDLDLCWRVYVIADNPTFPPLWRLRAQRTILPDHLISQLAEWKKWAQEVVAGKHDDYLRRIHIHCTSDFLRYHWGVLRGNATGSQRETADWTERCQIQEIREAILALPEPVVFEAPILPLETDSQPDGLASTDVFADARRVLELTIAWNNEVPSNWEVPYRTEDYEFTLDEFKKKGQDDWLSDFFAWADRCAESGFGFFLDY